MLAEMSGLDVNWGEAPHVLDTGWDPWSARTHAALFSNRGCSQALLLGILSRHVHSITLRLQRGAVRPGLALGCQTSLRLNKGHKGKVVAIAGNQMDICSLCAIAVPHSTRWPVFAWDRQVDRGVKPFHSSVDVLHLSQGAAYCYHSG